MLAITGTTGNLGGAVLHALVTHNLIPLNQLIICSSSDPHNSRWESLKAAGARVRPSNYDDPDSMLAAFSGCEKLFLVSSAHAEMDFGDKKDGEGREKHHIAAIKAAEAAGVGHIYYTSMALGTNSKATDMQAHERTERFLHNKVRSSTKITCIREGLYQESWPMYLGNYDPKHDERHEIVVAGDGPISWTSISDLGIANALVLVDPSTKYDGKTFQLSAPASTAKTLADVAKLVSKAADREIRLKVVTREEYRRFYVEEMKVDAGLIRWWETTYDALKDGEGAIEDPTLSDLLQSRGLTMKRMEETVTEMVSKPQLQSQ